MLLDNNPQLSKLGIEAKALHLCRLAKQPPSWPGEDAWQKSLEGRAVSLGASQRRAGRCAKDFHTLMQLQDDEFIEASMLVLLGRRPYEDERSEFLGRLHSGQDRETFLLDMDAMARRQDESFEGPTLPGLSWGLMLARVRRIPKVGRLVRWCHGLLRLDRLGADQQQSMRLQDARYHALLEQMRQQAQHIEELTKSLTEQLVEHEVLRYELRHRNSPSPLSSSETCRSTQQLPVASRPPQEQQKENGGDEVDFYRALEARFRGDPATIRELMKEHLVHVREVAPLKEGFPLLDLGCGRGEWLSLLSEEGLPARGVDINAANIKASRLQDLDVAYQDAIAALESCDDNSLGAVTSFHLVEHMHTDDLRTLLEQAWRALAPAGLLLLETPNPQNLIVSGCTFYLDPTHVRPIPPEFLAFLADFTGFSQVTTLPLHPVGEEQRLQEKTETALRLNHFLYGPQDYALIARKPVPDSRTPQEAKA